MEKRGKEVWGVDRKKLEQELLIRRELKIRECRSSFYTFCKTVDSKLYTSDKPHLKLLCDTLQSFYQRELGKDKLMINMPPRHGKTRTLTLFLAWALGRDNANKIISCSYNDSTASEFSRFTRDIIGDTTKTKALDITYDDIFPTTKLKDGNASVEKWALEGQFFNYLSSGTGGSVTGRGCNILILDDVVKSAEEAYNKTSLQKIWDWYRGTIQSRKEAGALEIVNMTRWCEEDVCGKILQSEDKDNWYILNLPACNKAGEMLCEAILSKEAYNSLQAIMDKYIFLANYNQITLNLEDLLYPQLLTYSQLPERFEKVISYTDTADEGKDYLCTIVAGILKGEAYVLDILYTQEGMTKTLEQLADLLYKYKPLQNTIESNNGGGFYAKQVEKTLFDRHKTRMVSIKSIHQSKNKTAKILSASHFVSNHIYFPPHWEQKYRDFANEITGHQKSKLGKNDDGADVLSEIAMLAETSNKFSGNIRLRIS